MRTSKALAMKSTRRSVHRGCPDWYARWNKLWLCQRGIHFSSCNCKWMVSLYSICRCHRCVQKTSWHGQPYLSTVHGTRLNSRNFGAARTKNTLIQVLSQETFLKAISHWRLGHRISTSSNTFVEHWEVLAIWRFAYAGSFGWCNSNFKLTYQLTSKKPENVTDDVTEREIRRTINDHSIQMRFGLNCKVNISKWNAIEKDRAYSAKKAPRTTLQSIIRA